MDIQKNPVNYLYFGLFFALLVLLSAGGIFSHENLVESKFYFLFYAIGQALLETLIFILIAKSIARFCGPKCFNFFIGFTFVAFLLHSIDFAMNRVLDISIWRTIKLYVLDESFDNFIYLLDASGVPFWMWCVIFALMATVPLIGVLLYKLSEKLTDKKPFFLRNKHLAQALFCIPCALAFWDHSTSKWIHPDAYSAFIQATPWKCTFFQPENVLLTTNGSIKRPPTEMAALDAIVNHQVAKEARPNIYIFVAESLRADAITADIAPHLHTFKNENISFDAAISGGNATQLCWFSIFHSQLACFWSELQKKWQMGSPALHMLKKLGYKIRLYSASELGYYNMEKFLFGKNYELLDSRQNFYHPPPANTAEGDAAAMAKLQTDLKDPSLHQGQVFLIFWDATHFDYDWPKNWTPKFQPYGKVSSYFRLFQSKKNISLIKNRYHNAVNFLDHLFGKFMSTLPNKKEAIIVFTGDHGEEFFEKGHLFHNSHLVKEQIHVPLLLKFGSAKIAKRAVASQLDIFPSIIDYVSGHPPSFLQGDSLFKENSHPYAITARYNAANTPYEFSIHNGKSKLIMQFQGESLDTKELRIVSLRDADDKSLMNMKDAKARILEEFGPAFNKLFNDQRAAASIDH